MGATLEIVGAGMAGLTTAYLLTKAGKSVIVLDDGPIVSGETERTTAHLATVLDDRFCELERLHGEPGARLAAESHAAAIDTIEDMHRLYNDIPIGSVTVSQTINGPAAVIWAVRSGRFGLFCGSGTLPVGVGTIWGVGIGRGLYVRFGPRSTVKASTVHPAACARANSSRA